MRRHVEGDFDNLKKGDLFGFFQNTQPELSGKVVGIVHLLELNEIVCFFLRKDEESNNISSADGATAWKNTFIRPTVFAQALVHQIGISVYHTQGMKTVI